MKKLALVGLAGALAAVGIAAPSIAGGNKYDPVATERACGDNDVVRLDGPLKLWPPNHKFVPEPVTADGSDNTEGVSIMLTPSYDEVAAQGDGGSQHDPDWNPSADQVKINGTGTATAQLELRAERAGTGNGRVYTINWTATFDNGSKTCTSKDAGQSPFEVEVPHDMGGGADWK